MAKWKRFKDQETGWVKYWAEKGLLTASLVKTSSAYKDAWEIRITHPKYGRRAVAGSSSIMEKMSPEEFLRKATHHSGTKKIDRWLWRD